MGCRALYLGSIPCPPELNDWPTDWTPTDWRPTDWSLTDEGAIKTVAEPHAAAVWPEAVAKVRRPGPEDEEALPDDRADRDTA